MISKCSLCSAKRSDSNKRMKSCRHKSSRRTDETSFPGNTEFSCGSYTRQSKEEVLPAHQMQLDKGTDSTRASMKRNPIGTLGTKCGEATMHIRNPKGTSRSPNRSSYIGMTFSTAKAAAS
ncbi:hypothetical protein AAG906_019023 [Vitis piasezkii]